MKLKTLAKAIGVSTVLLSMTACVLDGSDGQDGSTGPQGPQGEQGATGATGATGMDGKDAPKNILSRVELISNVNNSYFVADENAMEHNVAEQIAAARGRAKNVILFVGDGMGVSTVTASRIFEGQLRGQPGEENTLSFGAFPYVGMSKTYNVDSQTPDSAGTMTAMMSGVKTDVGVIGVAEDIVRGDCSSVAGNELVSALELAEIAGKSTGIISTARITHATPAATYAKSADRNWEDDGDMPQAAKDAGCEDIASQLVNFEPNLEARLGVQVDGIEVVMGGGRRSFLPKDAAFNSNDAVSAVEGDRTDGRDLTAEWTTRYPNGVYATDAAGLAAIDNDNVERVMALLNESHMQYEADRDNDVAGEPSLADLTKQAIDVLDNNDEGFFLMVEAGRIDHAHHAGNAFGALTDTLAFADAVRMADEATNDEDTLIIVTADHSHVMTIGGYPKRGNPILGKTVSVGSDTSALATDGMPYTTLTYSNGLGFRDLGSETDSDASYATAAFSGRVDLSSIDTEAPGFHQEALVPLGSETHAGEDVAIFAKGPGAHLVTGTNEQSIIYHVMDFAADLLTKAEDKL